MPDDVPTISDTLMFSYTMGAIFFFYWDSLGSRNQELVQSKCNVIEHKNDEIRRKCQA